MTLLVVPAAFLLDLIVGDPPWLPHPVVLIGRVIGGLERVLRGLIRYVRGGPGLERMAGVLLTVTVVAVTYAVTATAVIMAARLLEDLGMAVSVLLVSTTLASRGLGEAAMRVYAPLAKGNLGEARQMLSHIVGRRTESLPANEVARGAVESVAENTVDAVVAPLFYAFIGGAPLAMAYRAVNTLDSMVGYRNERYLNFGWASARLDDLANLLPARITGVLMTAASAICGLDAAAAWRAVARDAGRHPSPNSGIPEAAMAGALGVRLGGLNQYEGAVSFRAYMGDARRPLQAGDIITAVRVMQVTAFLAVVSGTLVLLLF